MRISRTKPVRRRHRARNIGQIERVGSFVSGSAIAAYGLGRRDKRGVLLALLGAGIAARGISGHSRLYDVLDVRRFAGARQDGAPIAGQAVRVQRSVTIDLPVRTIFEFWREFENLPRFMRHLESVEPLDGRTWRWRARAPFGSVGWDAEILDEEEDRFIAWRSLPGSMVPNSGSVQFKPLPDRQGTELKVELVYKPPAGALGALVARMLGEEPHQQVADDLRRLKQVLEAGEIPTTHGQPRGRCTG
jgi:uncharacterized membrane protein